MQPFWARFSRREGRPGARPNVMLRRFFWLLLGFAVLVYLIGQAEFRAPQFRQPIANAVADVVPGLSLESEHVFVRLIPWRGELRVRLRQTSLSHPQAMPEPLRVETLRLTFPAGQAITGQFRPTKVSLSGASVELTVPERLRDSLPQVQGDETAEDYWGFVFRSALVADLINQLPVDSFQEVTAQDVLIKLRGPGSNQEFLTFKLNRLRESTKGSLTGLIGATLKQRSLGVEGLIMSPTGQETPVSVQAMLNGGEVLSVSASVGTLVPAQYYQLLRYLNISTPERLTHGYRASGSADLNFASGQNAASLELVEVRNGQEIVLADASGQADTRAQRLELFVAFADVDMRKVAPWTPIAQTLQNVALSTDGGLEFWWDRSAGDWAGTFELHEGRGALAIPSIGLPAQAGAAIGVHQLKGAGRFDRAGIILDNLHLETGTPAAPGPILDAAISIGTQGPRPSVEVRLETQSISRGDLFFLWPTDGAPGMRRLMERMIEEGRFDSLKVTSINDGRAPTGRLQDLNLEIEAEFSQGQVSLPKSLPSLSAAVGKLHLKDWIIDIAVDESQLGPMALNDGRVSVDFSQPGWLSIDIDTNLAGELGAALRTLAYGEIGLRALQSLPIEQMTADSAGAGTLNLAFDPRTLNTRGIARENIDLDFALGVEQLRIPDFLFGSGVEDGALDLQISDTSVTGAGWAVHDGMRGEVNIDQTFMPGSPGRLAVIARGTVPTSKVKQFVPGLEVFLDGSAWGELTFVAQGGEDQRLNVDLDLANVAIDFPLLAYTKSPGQPGQARMDISLNEAGPRRADNMRISAPNLNLEGDVSLRAGGWRGGLLSEAQVNNTRLRDVRVQNLSDQYVVQIGGGQLDVEPLLASLQNQDNRGRGEGQGLAKVVVLEQAYFSNVRVGEGDRLQDARMALVLANDGVRGFTFNAAVPNARGLNGGRVDARLLRRGSGYALTAAADNFGALAAALGASDDMRGGTFRMEGSSRFPMGGGTWEISGRGEGMYLLDTPVLLDIISAISLTGILEQLSGTGLEISTLEFAGTIASPTLHLQRLKIEGPSIGFSIAGAFNWARGTMNFRGAVAPFNIINMILADVPVLGDLLTGTNGQGLLAAQFQIIGSTQSPNVQVDALSLLQPGLLREIIDGIEGQTY